MTVRVNTACSERGMPCSGWGWPAGGACGGSGSDGAWRARSWRRSRRMEGRSGWLFARGDGGAVI
jgi:hypothetical protein